MSISDLVAVGYVVVFGFLVLTLIVIGVLTLLDR